MSYLRQGDCIKLIKRIKNDSIHLILSDIPYGISLDGWDVLHNNTNSALLGTSPAQAEAGSVFKHRGKPLNGWSSEDKKIPIEYYHWCCKWAPELYRVMLPGASCFIFAGRRLAHRCICAMEDSGFIFKDMISWEKPQAAHRAQKVSTVLDNRGDTENSEKWKGWKIGNLRPLFEPILWFMKPYPQGSTLTDNVLAYEVGAYNEVSLQKNQYLNEGLEISANILKTEYFEEDHGLHDAQKPIKILQTIIELTTIENQIVLDPFMGSGSTPVAAIRCNRQYIGFEQEEKYFKVAEARIKQEKKDTQKRKKKLRET